jgi:hypothetical protein
MVGRLLHLGATVEEFNSNNGWGFGGAVGKRYRLKNNMVVTIATACFRHTGTTPFVRVDIDGKFGVIDLHQSQTAFAKVYNFVNENI